MKRLLPLLLLAACSREIPQDKLLDILNQRAPLVAHIGPVTKVDVLSAAKSAAGDGSARFSCEVRLLHVTGKNGSTYVSFLRREASGATESALTWADDRQAASGKMGEMLSEHCKS
ncbi:hypothetical protein [Pseudoduganella violaceinigra]|uniref:hypothetical protein n=1 Tax=Pseudoduganella violaceinigra TaxID=246602 RepID=UPI000408BFAA|nr:hypothetical protein [Pseudoduganella violaceinigra]